MLAVLLLTNNGIAARWYGGGHVKERNFIWDDVVDSQTLRKRPVKYTSDSSTLPPPLLSWGDINHVSLGSTRGALLLFLSIRTKMGIILL